MQMWRLMGIDEDGYPFEESNELTEADADKELARYQEFFPATIYYIEPYEYTEPKEERHYNENAIDGWEDMYPDRD